MVLEGLSDSKDDPHLPFCHHRLPPGDAQPHAAFHPLLNTLTLYILETHIFLILQLI